MIASKQENITSRQLFIYFALITPTIKMFVLPASYAFYGGKDSYLAVLCNCALDLLTLFAILYFAKSSNLGFFESLKALLSKPVAVAIYALYALYFAVKCFLPLFEGILLCHEVLYESSHSFVYFIPIFLALFYASSRPIQTLFKVVELIFPFALLASFGLIFLSAPSCDFSNLLPVLEFGATPLITAFARHIGWFGDFIALLILTDTVDFKAISTKKTALGYGVGAFSITLFFLFAIAIFGSTTDTQLFMLSKISKYSVVFSDLGRIDFIFIALLFLATMSYCLIACASSVRCVEKITGANRVAISAVIVAILLAACIIFIHKPFTPISFIEDWSLIIFAPLQYGVPLLLPILALFSNKKGVSACSKA